MGLCSCFNKFILVLLNFVVFAIGIAVIALASVVVHKGSEYGDLLLSGVLTLPIWALIVGIIITMIGFFGCCGAMKENKCMLITYATIVTVLFVAEVTLGILVALYPKQAEGYIKEGMSKGFEKYHENDTALDSSIDHMQHDLKCCGVSGPNDWIGYPYNKPPVSCCKDKSDSCNVLDNSQIYEKGCYDAILEDLEGVTMALGISAIALAIVQIVCVCIACGLSQRRSQYV